VQAVTLDGRKLFYATETALHRLILPRRGSTEPPPNDDLEAATPLTLERYVDGWTGHATRQPTEPGMADRTVWYRFRAPLTETLQFIAFAPHQLFVGSAMANLVPVPVGPFSTSVDVTAGQDYWMQVWNSGPYPTYEPFRVGVSRFDYVPW
jgi:hypothetical protein